MSDAGSDDSIRRCTCCGAWAWALRPCTTCHTPAVSVPEPNRKTA